jgi:hypothetical protein
MRTYIALIVIMFLSTVATAQKGDGGYAGAFLRMGVNARAAALGDAHSALPEGSVAGFYNPGLLPYLAGRSVTLSYSFLPLDRSMHYIGYAQSLHPSPEDAGALAAGFSLAWIGAGVDNIDGRDGSGQHTQTFSHSNHAFYLSFALSPHPYVSIGVSGKILWNRFPQLENDGSALSSQSFGLDFGAFITPFQNLMMGVVLRDRLSKFTWNTDQVWDRGTSTTNAFPKSYRIAVSYRIPQDWLLFCTELENSDKQNPRYHFGLEANILHYGALRLGLDDDLPAFGFGLNVPVLGRKSMFDYTFIATGQTPGADHLLGWTFDF